MSQLQKNEEPVAIVGMALRVPGANSPEQFWDNLVNGRESISRFEKDELDFPEEFDQPNYVPAKGIVEDIDKFDAAFFGILPKDAKIMDPQQRIFLELAWEAMERAGHRPDGTHSDRIGVYAGAYIDSYLLANLCTDRTFLDDTIRQIRVGSLQTELGNDKDYLATRVAFKMNLRGPAVSVGSACSTSLVAVAEACRSIRDGQCDAALAGGVAITLPHKRGYFHTEQGINSADGHCRVFDEKGSGTVFGNGAGVVMLKRLSKALEDGNHIHAVIRGTGMNNDGSTKNSYAAPSIEGQSEAIRMAWENAGIDPRTVSMIEAHGTGTPLGDPIEFNGLSKAFRDAGVKENQFCALGSLKTYIGHLDVASGVCGLIKAALSLEKKTMPQLLHFQSANPSIDFENSPFYPLAKLEPWTTEGPRRAGVSSYGVGGTNAHLVLEEAPLSKPSGPSPRTNHLILISAKSESSLNATADRLASFESSAPVADISWTLIKGRSHLPCRRAAAGSDLSALKGNGTNAKAERGNAPIHFLFPGQGAQHLNMAKSIYDSEPHFRTVVDRCNEIAKPLLDGESLLDILFSENSEKLTDTKYAQPAIFMIEYAIADLWIHWGITPKAMIGHSVGEFVAACHSGVFSLEDAISVVAKRGALMSRLPAGKMLSVRLAEKDLMARMPDTLDLAAVNGKTLCVVAGPEAEISTFAAQLAGDDIIARPLHTSHAFHSRMMDSVIPEFEKAFAEVTLRTPQIPIMSSVTGAWMFYENAVDTSYWANHLRKTVRFSDAMEVLGAEASGQIFIETGPGQTLTGLAAQTLKREDSHLVLPSCRHPKDDDSDHICLLRSLGALWCEGVEIDWDNYFTDEYRKRAVLPGYAFEKKRHWVDPTPAAPIQLGTVTDCTGYYLTQQGTITHSTGYNQAAAPLKPPMKTTTASRNSEIANRVREILTNLSGIPTEDLIGNATFLELGFDSLLLTQVSKAFQDGFGTEVKMRQLMTDFSTIDAMVEHLDETLPAEEFRQEQVVEQPPAPVHAPAPVVTGFQPAPAVGSSAIENLIQQQMDIMRQQLALLGSAPGARVPQISSPFTPTPAPTPQKPIVATAAGESSAPSTTINRDVDDSLTEKQKNHLEALVKNYTSKTKTSKSLTEEYRQWFADPRTVSGFNRLWKEMIYQIVVEKSKGSRLVDIDGNEYIDLLNGFGPGFLGHSPDFLTQALHEQLDRGVEVGPQCRTAMEAAKLFCEVTGNERASFVNTGSEAVQAAMRLTRTVTGRDKIVVFAKDYHGNFDEVLVRGVGSGDKLRSMPVAPGIPNRAVEDVIVLPYGTEESLQVIRNRAHELAAVIVEPVQSRRPEFQPKEFIHELRKITADSGTAFVFDEVITGFRAGPHGAQGFFGVEADLATYGKVCGGGMPIGVVAGKAKYMDTFDGGQWQYGDDSFPEQGVTFFAGTFVRHPLAMVAMKQMLLHLREQGSDLWTNLNAKADRLTGAVNQLFRENDIPFEMPNFGSLMFIRHIDNNKYANLLFFHLRSKGIFLLEGFPSYITTAHTDADIDYTIDAFRESVSEMQQAGFFPGEKIDSSIRKTLTGPPRVLTKGATSSEPETYPMTEPLAEIWLASQASDDGTLCFNEVVKLSFEGDLNIPALQQAIQDVVNRHEGLRATFLSDGTGFRIKDHLEIDLEFSDSTIAEALENHQNTKFDLEKGPLFRAELLTHSENHNELILNAHHLVCDGWSFNIVVDEISQSYAARLNGEKAAFPPAPQFGAFAQQESVIEKCREGGESEKYWLSRFSTAVPPLDLPHDGTGTPSHKSDSVCAIIDGDTMRSLKSVAGQSGTTLFSVLMGAYQILLSRIARQDRLMTVFPVAGQNDDQGNENLVGHCVNFLPFPCQIDTSRSVRDFLGQTQENLLDAMEHRDYTWGRLIKKLPGSKRPVAEAVFNLERMDGYEEFPWLETQIEDVTRKFSHNPLFLNTLEHDNALELDLNYQTGLFSRETARLWLNLYSEILDQIVQNPDVSIADVTSSISSGTLEEIRSWNRTSSPYPWKETIGEVFDNIAIEHPDATAITSEDGSLTYEEFSTLIDRVAHQLSIVGVGKDDRVGLFLEQSPERIASIFAILKLGAVYVPLDPEYPSDRIDYMVKDSMVVTVVTQQSLAARISDNIDSIVQIEDAGKSEAPRTKLSAFSGRNPATTPACIIYTSGSTGTPKGVVVPHRGIVRLVKNTNYCNLGPEQTILQASSICFDASTFEIFGALLNGGTLALPKPGPQTLDALATAIRKMKVTTLWLTSGLFQLMVEENIGAFKKVQQVLTGGDVVPVRHASVIMKKYPNLTLINGYGPTENTTFTCCHTITRNDLHRPTLPVGKPVSNTTVWILDAKGKPVPPGIPGELCCGGDGLAIEYLNAPELTEEKFIFADVGADKPTRLYRTGDLARFRTDGVVEFLGRIDRQIKIRGFRVEPGEIESQIAKNPLVGQCKVIPEGERAGDKSLVAYVSPMNGKSPDPDELKRSLSEVLPSYMVPGTCIVLDELPVTANGKIDTDALSRAHHSSSTSSKQTSGSPTETEKRLISIWKDVLKSRDIHRDDNFFDLGGHSLLGMKLFGRIQKEFGLSLPLSLLFDASTVRSLARELDLRTAEITTAIPTQQETPKSPAVAEHTVSLQPQGDLPPLFGVHGGDGGVFFYRNLSKLLKKDRPFYAFEASVLTTGGPISKMSVEETAARYVDELLKIHAAGPVHLCGYSFGGVVAYEMACQLSEKNIDVGFLGLIDTENPAAEVRRLSLTERVATNWNDPVAADSNALRKAARLGKRVGTGLGYRLRFGTEGVVARALPTAEKTGWLRQVQVRNAYEEAMVNYTPGIYSGNLTLFRAIEGNDKFERDVDYEWGEVVTGEIKTVDVPGNHISIFHKENIGGIAESLQKELSMIPDEVIS
ncbi:MAG: amino acid adenylation domain-containing protein [Verrucomicrobiales bacterium]|nr:amino acid adenylation domain-containing protein [Verrucomicrobiales bacterium]